MTYMPRVTVFGRHAVKITARPGEFLELDAIRRHAPTIFATEAHSSRSAKFVHLPTDDLLKALMKEGFQATEIRVGGSKDEVKRSFTKHMIRLRRSGVVPKLGGLIPEVVLQNGHDGTSAYALMAGLMRLVCMNGVVVPDSLFTDIKVPHKGDALSRVIEGSYTVLDQSTKVLDHAEAMQSVSLSRDERVAFARAATALRWDDESLPTDLRNEPERLLVARREPDRGADLWRTFNRVQENLIRGGIEFNTVRQVAGGEAIRHNTTRAIQSVDGDIKLNRALWTLAEEMRRLKA